MKVKRHFMRFAFKYAHGDNVAVGFSLPDRIPKNHDELLEIESRFQVFDLYTWLANRYPVRFICHDLAYCTLAYDALCNGVFIDAL